MSQFQSFLKSLAFAMALMASSPAFALTINHPWPDTLALVGTIEPGDGAGFLSFFMPPISDGTQAITTISIASPGGSVSDAMLIGNFIRARGFKTLVPWGATCESACPLIWIAGTTRESHGQLGMHRPYGVMFGGSYKLTDSEIDHDRGYWVRMGGSLQAFELGMQKGPNEMATFSPEELTGAPVAPEPASAPATKAMKEALPAKAPAHTTAMRKKRLEAHERQRNG
jgi:hypothetical protein